MYVLITPARNEESFIGKTIEAVAAQSVLPKEWVIVNDGSTDRTEEVVASYQRDHSFIRLISVSEHQGRNFNSKAYAFQAGYRRLESKDYHFIGNLDADVSFESDYYKNILEKFSENLKLGIAGGIIAELVNNVYVLQNISLNSVAGATQLFRRECYENIGGYIPIMTGGIDTAAEIMARSKGWEVRTFPELTVLHHRRVASGKGNILAEGFRKGISHYLLGYHPLFQVARYMSRIKDKPYILGSFFILSGYLWALVRRYKRPIPDDVVRYLRKEQMRRLWSFLATGSRQKTGSG
ncbi:MAG: glycosyltransferase family A protein [Proteobacteria bacterium]|nr:glycosyltransferase family A protein [Pseudomonadota bacterium]